MPSSIALPDCLMQTYTSLFPTLDFSRISFFLGIKAPFSWGSQQAMTLPSGISGIHIYIREESYNPCSREFFLLIAHELVHALQIERSLFGGRGLGLFNGFSYAYLSCYLPRHSDEEDNRLEKEAYDYEEQLARCLDRFPGDQQLPCDCATIPWLASNPNFVGVEALQNRCGGIVKGDALTGSCCPQVLGFGEGGSTGEVTSALSWTVVGIVVGAVVADGLGAIVGGALAGVLEMRGCVPSRILTLVIAFIGAAVDAIMAAFRAMKEFFFPGERPLNLLFSRDDGSTFGDKTTLAKSSEPPAVVLTPTRFFAGWTSSNNRLNVFSAPNPTHLETFEWASDDAGPALAHGNNLLFLVWERKKNRLHFRSSTDGENFTARRKLDEQVPDDASPGLAFGGRLHLAWIRKKKEKIALKSSPDSGATWEKEITLDERSTKWGTPALAFGDGRVFLAWVGRKKQKLHLITFNISGSGDLSVGARFDLDERSTKKAGPALAFGNNRLFLAWIGEKKRKLRVISFDVSAQGALTQRSNVVINEVARKNVGPGLAYQAGLLCVAWISKS